MKKRHSFDQLLNLAIDSQRFGDMDDELSYLLNEDTDSSELFEDELELVYAAAKPSDSFPES